ncbi:ABC transporter ATP-binding protein [Carboxydochorda subterranea]|uniref:ABC transporter ATP-binding protein n=1 Tax=Carboxydichorda subterranea TaxID=3109565 RepID=A0ABZ1BX69_9FIRM|nr:ABC transporter ATP-binding protein [Limnochorda sp. L945t]WRP17396.1 ABC transporter ATP-binding protein [Limnochorda sp. L945t]
MLSLADIHFGYGDQPVLRGVNLEVQAGEMVVLVGSNGAGKTTTLRVISGLVKPWKGMVTLDGDRLDGQPPHRIVEAGVVQVPEGRHVFPKMSVLDNLLLGASRPEAWRQRRETLDEVFEVLPLLRGRLRQMAGTLSGGEQQMLAIGRALMAKPALLLLDEPTLGLAPLVASEILEVIGRLNSGGLAVLLVSQQVTEVLRRAHRAYVLSGGTVVRHGAPAELLSDASLIEAYFGRAHGSSALTGKPCRQAPHVPHQA